MKKGEKKNERKRWKGRKIERKIGGELREGRYRIGTRKGATWIICYNS